MKIGLIDVDGHHYPNLVKAAWNVFGDSYRYRQAYNEYKAERTRREKEAKKAGTGQMVIDGV